MCLEGTGRGLPPGDAARDLPPSPEEVPVRPSALRRGPPRGEFRALPPDRLPPPSNRFRSSWGSPFIVYPTRGNRLWRYLVIAEGFSAGRPGPHPLTYSQHYQTPDSANPHPRTPLLPIFR